MQTGLEFIPVFSSTFKIPLEGLDLSRISAHARLFTSTTSEQAYHSVVDIFLLRVLNIGNSGVRHFTGESKGGGDGARKDGRLIQITETWQSAGQPSRTFMVKNSSRWSRRVTSLSFMPLLPQCTSSNFKDRLKCHQCIAINAECERYLSRP
jgi:hypothetical protein